MDSNHRGALNALPLYRRALSTTQPSTLAIIIIWHSRFLCVIAFVASQLESVLQKKYARRTSESNLKQADDRAQWSQVTRGWIA